VRRSNQLSYSGTLLERKRFYKVVLSQEKMGKKRHDSGIINLWGNYDRVGPVEWVFIFGLIFLFVGIWLWIFALGGGLILFVYMGFGVIWISQNIKRMR
jgi:hypothetical protein